MDVLSEGIVTLSKIINEAIRQEWPMYWAGTPDSWALELRAVTATRENGTVRTRLLAMRYDEADVRSLSIDIQRAGGRIDLEDTSRVIAARAESWRQTEKELRL